MGTAVARNEEQPKGIVGLLESEKARTTIVPLLPEGVSFERVVREVYLAAQEQPQILQCTPASIVTAVARGCAWGGVFGEDIHLVPYNVNVAPKGEPKQWEKRLRALQDYKFKAELIVRTGAARAIDAHCFYANEPFRYQQGLRPDLEHRPIADPAARGPMLGAYAVAWLAHGLTKILVLSLAEIEVTRSKSQSWSHGECPDWYAKKTAVHRLAKLLPKNPRLAKVLGIIDQDDDETDAVPDNGPVAIQEPKARGVLRAVPVTDDLRPMNRDHAFRHSDGSYDLDAPPTDGEAEAPELGLDVAPAKPSTQIRD